jgi:hypothetical protein
MARRPTLQPEQLSLALDDGRNRPPAAPPTPEIIETLAELLLAAATAMEGGSSDDAREVHS